MILSKTPLRSAVFCAFLASVLVACGGDHKEYFYNTLAEADRAGEITRGWIPEDLMPGSSRSMHLVEELSPSREWCAFEFLPTDSRRLRKNLRRVDALTPSVRRVPSPGVSWWPAVLKGNLDVDKIHRAGFELYVAERPANSVEMSIYLFALDWSNGRGFFYYTYESGSIPPPGS
jgi:hypothetical protein